MIAGDCAIHLVSMPDLLMSAGYCRKVPTEQTGTSNGHANILVVPDLEAGNMLAKSLSFLAGADAAGIVLGARVPDILTSRADSLLTRLASCAVAVQVARMRREASVKAVA